MAEQIAKTHRNIDFEKAATAVYGTPKKKRKKRIEKVKKPKHWDKDFQPKHKPNQSKTLRGN